tara:strand:- start:1299 stop:1469 length:171 start_codon:yes stop_codon:yes gene_type:complete
MMTNFEKESAIVDSDMKEWAKEHGLTINGLTIILYAMDRGWLQTNFTGLEMPHEEY